MGFKEFRGLSKGLKGVSFGFRDFRGFQRVSRSFSEGYQVVSEAFRHHGSFRGSSGHFGSNIDMSISGEVRRFPGDVEEFQGILGMFKGVLGDFRQAQRF